MKYNFGTGCLIFFLASAAWAGDDTNRSDGDTLRISLQQSVLTALDRNPELAIQRLNPAISRSYAAEQRAAFDPAFSLSGNVSENKTQRFLGSRPEPFELTSKRTQYTAALSEFLPTGTTLSIDASLDGSTSSIYQPQYSGNIAVTVTQSLLQGLGPAANLASLRKARLDQEISGYELQALAEEVLARTETAYWDLYLAGREIVIQKESLELANQQMGESLERVAVGKLPELELAAVRAEVARRQASLIDAQSAYDQARLDFLFLLNPSDRFSWDIIPVPVDQPGVVSDSLEAITIHEAVALKYRPDLEEARLEYKKGDLDVTLTRNGLLPRLDFFIILGRTTYARTFQEALPDVQSPFYNINAGVNFEFPIPNRQARAQALRAVKTREQLDYSLKNMERMVEKDIRTAYMEVLRTKQQIQAARSIRNLQEKNLEAELEKFRVGKSTNLLVLQVQRDLTAARLDDIQAVVNYLEALINFYVAEGTLLQRRSIAVEVGGWH